MRIQILLAGLALLAIQCKSDKEEKEEKKHPEEEFQQAPQYNKDTQQVMHYPEEKHFKNVRQVTFGGNNAEAYFSFDDDFITFQSDNPAWNVKCDQIFSMSMTDIANSLLAKKDERPAMISENEGRTTCSYYMPGNQEILFASTHKSGKECPPKPAPRSDHKYLWPIYDSYDIFVAELDGTITKQLTNQIGYDAEATVSRNGDKIVFTSTRSGDLELWTMNIDGTNQKQITNGLGYDGGAFFSPDGKKIVFRASRPKSAEEVKEYEDFLKQGLVAPGKMEIYTCNVDGSDLKQITNLGNANWAPFFHPSGKKIIFASNHKQGGFHFNLYMINLDGTGVGQITFDPAFDAFPMFSFDGKKLIFSSNRNNGGTHDTNIFLAEWVE